MKPFVENVSLVLSGAAIALQVLIVIGTIASVRAPHVLNPSIQRSYPWAVLCVSLTAICMSLFYSEYAGFVPCSLCWYQRIAIYPLAVIALISLARRHVSALADTVLGLSIIGAFIAAYNYYGQMFSPSSLPCAAKGAASCAFIPFIHFGYVTLPMMSLTAFSLLIALTLAYKRASRGSCSLRSSGRPD